MQALPEMSKWRERLWPVYSYELKKFVPMVIIMFWILFNYTVVRNLKDALLVNAPHSSGHVLPWAKILIVTPASIIFVLGYAKLSNILSKEKLYYTCLLMFTAFFILFSFVLYPLRHFLNVSPEKIYSWQLQFPGLKDLFPVFGYWTFTLFYAMAELWGNIAVAVLFWQFANQITPTSEAKRFYPIFGFWSNLGLVCAGLLTKYAEPLLDALTVKLASGERDFSVQVKFLVSFVIFGCVIIGLVYWWMTKNVLTDPRLYDEARMFKKGKEKKPKLSVSESIKFLTQSKYLGYIAVLMLCYGITINLVEVSWKDAVKEYFTDPITHKRNEGLYSAFMGDLYIYTGLLTMGMILFSQNIMRLLGWKFSASVTPWITLITGVLFFFFLVFKDSTTELCAMMGATPLGMAIWLGLAQNSITKAAKYALFDPTKEMAYIPLDEESKIKGKAAIDVVGGRAGKAGGSILNVIFKSFFSMGSFCAAIGSIMTAICLWWLWAVGKLSNAYQQKLEERKREEEGTRETESSFLSK